MAHILNSTGAAIDFHYIMEINGCRGDAIDSLEWDVGGVLRFVDGEVVQQTCEEDEQFHPGEILTQTDTTTWNWIAEFKFAYFIGYKGMGCNLCNFLLNITQICNWLIFTLNS